MAMCASSIPIVFWPRFGCQASSAADAPPRSFNSRRLTASSCARNEATSTERRPAGTVRRWVTVFTWGSRVRVEEAKGRDRYCRQHGRATAHVIPGRPAGVNRAAERGRELQLSAGLPVGRGHVGAPGGGREPPERLVGLGTGGEGARAERARVRPLEDRKSVV